MWQLGFYQIAGMSVNIRAPNGATSGLNICGEQLLAE